MQKFWQELRFGFRVLLRRPTLTTAVLLSLMLGIGVNTAVFTMLFRVFSGPLPVENPQELVAIFQTLRDKAKGEYTGFRSQSPLNYVDYRDENQTLAGMALHQWAYMNLTGREEPQRVLGVYASHNYFAVLGLKPAKGRFFSAEEAADIRAKTPVVVLSHAFWTRSYANDPDIVGKAVQINGVPFTVIGVAPKGFQGTLLEISMDLWIPVGWFQQLSPFKNFFENRDTSLFQAFGRLKPGVSREQAEADLTALSLRISAAYYRNDESSTVVMLPLTEGVFRPQDRERYLGYGRTLLVVAAFILLISCFNVANLLLVRGLERQREIATRLAMGCSRAQIITQLSVENLGLFLLGGLLSLGVARLSLDFLWKFRPPQFSANVLNLHLDAKVLGFTLGLSLLTGLLFGLVPALRAAQPDLVQTLKSGSTGLARVSRWRALRPQNLLVIAQIALTLTALIGAGLLVRTLRNAQQIDLGFSYQDMAVLSFSPGEQGYDPEQTRALYQSILERVRALPGVRSATLAANRLLRGSTLQQQVFFEGEQLAAQLNGREFQRTNIVVPGYFETVGIPLLQGRDFDDTIRADSPAVAIINQTMAQTGWPGKDPIGKRFSFHYPDDPKIEVIGVVQDAIYREIPEQPQLFIYLPHVQAHMAGATLHVRVDGNPATFLPTLRREVQSLAPNLVLAEVQPLSWFIGEALWLQRMSANLLLSLAVLALVVAVVGVYGVLTYAVNRRQREIATRIALGAQRAHLQQMIFKEVVILIGCGWLFGLGLSLFVLRPLIASQLMGVAATDPAVYLLQSLALLVAACAGATLPVWKATKTDPMLVLRGE
jgi:predicted permease